jgi:hypothetical protein
MMLMATRLTTGATDVRYRLCYVPSFILMNLVQSAADHMAARNRMLLSKWRDTLRTQASAWPLARLAAVRLHAVFWKGLPSVVHAEGPDGPAFQLFRDQGSTGTGQARAS